MYLRIFFILLLIGLLPHYGMAQTDAYNIVDHQREVNARKINQEIADIRQNFRSIDPTFFEAAAALRDYCAEEKFTSPEQLRFQKRVLYLLQRMEDAESFRNGRYTDALRFGFTILDWRHDGILYDNLSAYIEPSLRCAALYADDTAGIRFLQHIATEDPIQIIRIADLLDDNALYRSMMEQCIIHDPDFAKRYFFTQGILLDVAEHSTDQMVKDIYTFYKTYGSKTKAYVLYDPVYHHTLSVAQVDSIARDNVTMIKAIVRTLSQPKPLALSSLQREIDYRAVDWVREASTFTVPQLNAAFNRFTADEMLVVFTHGYRECSPHTYDRLLSIIQSEGLSGINPALLLNINKEALTALMQSLDQTGKLPYFLSLFSEGDRIRLHQMIGVDNRTYSAPPMRDISPKRDSVSVLSNSIPIEIPEKSANPIAFNDKKIKTENPDEVVVKPLDLHLTDGDKKLLALKKNIYKTLQDVPAFVNEKYAKELLLYAAQIEPDEIFKKTDAFKGKYWCREVLESAALLSPLSARRYLANPLHPVSVILHYSANPIIKKIITLAESSQFLAKPFLLLDDIVTYQMSWEEAVKISSDPPLLFREMMKVTTRPTALGMYNIESEMNYYALRFMRDINDRIAEPEAARFSTVDGLTCDELYYLMVYGRDEVFSTTFTGLFTRFEAKCGNRGDWTVRRFTALPHYRAFMELCATYGSLDKLCNLFHADERTALIEALIRTDTTYTRLTDAAIIAETIANTTTPTLLDMMERQVKKEYQAAEAADNGSAQVLYGILTGLFKDKPIADKNWCKATAQRFHTGALTVLPASTFKEGKAFIERMYFYDDEDGRDSYINFLKTFSSARDWRVDEQYSYTRITSLSGNPIEIFANKPELEESGDKEICKLIADNNYSVGAVIHRGHSFHTEKTLMRVPATAHFVFVGSCGGFYKINIALRNAPDAHIIATRQIGIKQINDPIVFAFSEYARQGKDIKWESFWNEMKAKLGSMSLFYDYVPPHRNLESLFVRAYYQLLSK